MPKEVLDPDDPSSYHLPPELQSEEFAFGGSGRKGRAGGEEVLPPGDEETVLTEKMAGEDRKKAELEGDEEERAPASRLPQMKPMPSKSGRNLTAKFQLYRVGDPGGQLLDFVDLNLAVKSGCEKLGKNG